MRLLDSSVVLASLHEAEPHHEACSALLLQGGHALYVHALAEVFSTLTGGAQGLRVGADLAQQLLRESVLPYVKTVTLAERDVMAALAQAQARGVRGGAVYDYLHLVAARKAGRSVNSTSGGDTLRFEHFEIDTTQRQVRVNGQPVALGARAFDSTVASACGLTLSGAVNSCAQGAGIGLTTTGWSTWPVPGARRLMQAGSQPWPQPGSAPAGACSRRRQHSAPPARRSAASTGPSTKRLR
jgi:predicted nucleic acid-binding protein